MALLLILTVLHVSVVRAQLEIDILSGAQVLDKRSMIGFGKSGPLGLDAMACMEQMLASGDFPAVEKAFLANKSIAETAMGRTHFGIMAGVGDVVAFFATLGPPGSQSAETARAIVRGVAQPFGGPGLSGDFDSSQAGVGVEYISHCSPSPDEAPKGPGLGGTIVDEDGNPLDPRQFLWRGGGSSGNRSSSHGTFIWNRIMYAPETIEFIHPGYQAKVLLRGRDFEMGDLDIRVQLEPGPFPAHQSIFKVVTGYEYGNRRHFPGASYYLAQIGWYRKMAGNDEGAWLRVLDGDGEPIDTLSVVQWWNPRLSLPDTRVQKELRVRTLAGEDGWYTISFPPVYVWAPGFGGSWFAPDRRDTEVEMHRLVLRPAAMIRLTVIAPDGRPQAGVYVSVRAKPRDPRWGRQAVKTLTPLTDDRGTVEFPNLAPGDYSILVTDSGGRSTELDVSVQVGETADREITF